MKNKKSDIINLLVSNNLFNRWVIGTTLRKNYKILYYNKYFVVIA